MNRIALKSRSLGNDIESEDRSIDQQSLRIHTPVGYIPVVDLRSTGRHNTFNKVADQLSVNDNLASNMLE